MRKIGMFAAAVPFIILVVTALASHQAPFYAGSILGSADGDACSKEICDSTAVIDSMGSRRNDLTARHGEDPT
jgi:hypothetical protein